MAKNIFYLLIFLTSCSSLYAQSKEPADYTQAIKLYKDSKFDAALPLFVKSLPRLAVATNSDSLVLASCYNYIGLCQYMQLDFTAALDNFYTSRDLYSLLNSASNVAVILKNISLSYKNARVNEVAIKSVVFDEDNSGEFYFSVTKIDSLTKDSAIVTINEGKQDGLFPGAKGNIVSSYAVGEKPGRNENEYLGTATIIELTDYSAKAIIHFYEKYKGVQIFPKDLLALKAYVVKGVQKNVFYELARLNVLFLDNSREELISAKTILFNTDPALEDILLKLYTNEITGFYESIKEYDTVASFVDTYTKGRFKGNNLIEAFKITATFDLKSFFNFVKTFPAKYMGTDWKINETYATWVLNECLQGEKNRAWLLPVIENTNFAGLDSLIQQAGYYISYDSLSLWGSRITALQNNHAIDEAEVLCNKLLHIAKKLKDTHAENEFYYARSFIYEAQGKKLLAIAENKRAYNNDKTNIDYMYGLASQYGKNEYFDSAFALYDQLLKLLPANINIAGNYGWYKILSGQVDAAIPLCRLAYEGNPWSVAFTVNYGHTFLLKGNRDSALYYYRKMLENLATPADYTEGPKKDFEIFFTKGWQRKNVGEMADLLDTEFKDKYYAITQSKIVWENAKNNYDNGRYKLAIKEWQDYIALFDKSKEPPLSSIHNALNWMGLSFESLGFYDSAIVYYETANQMALLHLVKERDKDVTPYNDLVVNNYNRMFNYYTTIKNETKALEYKALYEAEVSKVTELFTTPQLHFICLGGNSKTYAIANQSNAKLMFDNLAKISAIPDSLNNNQLLTGATLTKPKLLNAIAQISLKSRPEDIFVFYYAGATLEDKEETFISFNPADTVNGRINKHDLINSIGQVYAHKKLIIMDKPNPVMLSAIAAKYTSAENAASELIFMCPGIETPLQKNNASLFTNELVNALTELQKTSKFSAKDFIDKAAYTIGRGQYYLPVLSFSSGKDFLLFENKTVKADNVQSLAETRGVKIPVSNNNADVNAAAPQKNYALIFATNIYDNKKEFPTLANPIFDARTIDTMLRTEFDFATELILDANREEIQNLLRKYRDSIKMGSNDQLFIFFAGHGIFDANANMGYLVAKDSKAHDPDKDSYLSYIDLCNKYLLNFKSQRVFLVLDACMAGTFFGQNSLRGTAQEIAAENLQRLKNASANRRYHKGISSGGKEYVADGKPGQHSPFARSLIHTLHTVSHKKNFVTAEEIIGMLKSESPGQTGVNAGEFADTDPQGNFIFELKPSDKVSTIKEDKLDPKKGSFGKGGK